MRRFNFDGRKLLLVGGAGYVGSVMAEEFLNTGSQVHVLDNFIYGNGQSLARLVEHPGFSYTCGDFGDSQTLTQALGKITDVVLLASLVGDPICKQYPLLARSTNKDASIRLFETLKDSAVERFIFASTCSNYGIYKDGGMASEDATLNPQSLYADTKIAVERHILDSGDRLTFSPTILRISTAYGLSPRMRFDLTISDFTKTLAQGEPLLVYDADTWRPYCHVRDIAKACMTVLAHPRERVSGEVFNVGNQDQQFTKRMVVDEISKYVSGPEIEYKEGTTDPRDYRVSFGKITDQLGFKCDQTVQDYIPVLVRCLNDGMFPRESRQRYGNYDIPGAN